MNKSIVETVFTALDFNESKAKATDMDRVLNCYAEDSDLRFGSGPLLEGKDAIQAAYTGLVSMFEYMEHVLTRFIIDGDQIAVEGYGIFKPLGADETEMPFADIFVLKDGKVIYHRAYTDMSAIGG